MRRCSIAVQDVRWSNALLQAPSQSTGPTFLEEDPRLIGPALVHLHHQLDGGNPLDLSRGQPGTDLLRAEGVNYTPPWKEALPPACPGIGRSVTTAARAEVPVKSSSRAGASAAVARATPVMPGLKLPTAWTGTSQSTARSCKGSGVTGGTGGEWPPRWGRLTWTHSVESSSIVCVIASILPLALVGY